MPNLERVTVAGLPKISTAMRIFRSWAESAGLRPSETVYVSWTRDRRRLQFSKSGEPSIERAYRTHWVAGEAGAKTAERAVLIAFRSTASGSKSSPTRSRWSS